MSLIVQNILELLGKGWSAVAVALLVVFLSSKEVFRLWVYYLDRKDKYHDFAKNLLDQNMLTQEANRFLRESLEKEAFFKYYRIHAEALMRSSLISFHKRNQRELKWVDIRRAYPYVSLSQEGLEVNLKWYNKGERFFIFILSVCGFLFSAFVFVSAFFVIKNSIQFFVLIGWAIFYFFTSMVVCSMGWPYDSAKKIQKLILKNKT